MKLAETDAVQSPTSKKKSMPLVSAPLIIKRLRIHGFKAFGDTTIINFMGGTSAFAGPNGCGKSNIVDAIRWVTGEQRFSNLRGDGLKDLIFHGGDKTRQSNYAEVELVLDNSNRKLDSPFPEISVSRRVYRSGETECFINKASCRLKDITHLFKSILGKFAFPIVAQGRVEEISSGSAKTRRRIIEEVAGISLFREKKIEYENRKKENVVNLSRLKDFIAALLRQEKSLFRQAEECRRYYDLKAKINLLQIQKFVLEYWDFHDRVEAGWKEIEKINDALKIKRKQIHLIEREIKEITGREKKLNDRLSDLKKEKIEGSTWETVKQEKQEMQNKMLTLGRQRKEEAVEKVEQINDKQSDWQETFERIQKFEQSIKDELKGVLKERQEKQTLMQSLQSNLVKISEKQVEDKKNFEEAKKNILQLDEQAEYCSQEVLAKLKEADETIEKKGQNQNFSFPLKVKELISKWETVKRDSSNGMRDFEELLKIFAKESEKYIRTLEVKVLSFENILEIFEKRNQILDNKRSREESIEKMSLVIEQNISSRKKTETALEEVKSLLYKLQVDEQFLLEKEKNNKSELAVLQSKKIELEKQKVESETFLKKCDEELRTILSQRESYEAEEKQVKENIFNIEKKIDELKQNVNVEVAKLNERKNELEKESKEVHSLSEQKINAQNNVEILKNNLSNLSNNVKLLLEVDVKEQANIFETNRNELYLSRNENEAKLVKLERQLKNRDKINPLALEEYQKTTEEINSIKKQKDDVEKGIANLNLLVQDIEKKSAEIYQKTFDGINVAFKELVPKLFIGGKGGTFIRR